MITLYTFGPAFGLPDPSPFVVKTLIQLKMSGRPFQVDTTGVFKAPKGKLPYLLDDGQLVADSTFIRWHLEEKYGVDLDQGLSPEQRATAWAIEKLMEDNLYWIGVHGRWIHEGNFRKVADVFFRKVPWPLRPLVETLVRRRFKGYLRSQGMGRHGEAEMLRIGRRTVESLATLLGDKAYMMGPQPSGVDAMVYAMLASALCPHFELPMRQIVQSHPNLVVYHERMWRRYVADDTRADAPEVRAAA
jgi:glutathione S-transferase